MLSRSGNVGSPGISQETTTAGRKLVQSPPTRNLPSGREALERFVVVHATTRPGVVHSPVQHLRRAADRTGRDSLCKQMTPTSSS